MTIEERLERLETFIGNIDRITSVYANTVQEICDKYLNLLYIETPDENQKNVLIIDGFLSDLENEEVPKNVVFNIKPSHTLSYDSPEDPCILRLKRDNTYVDVALRKYDIDNPGNLIPLNEGDYIEGLVYNVYINSQNIAVISTSDSGNKALQELEVVKESIGLLDTALRKLSTNFKTTTIEADALTVANEAAIKKLTLSENLSIPTGSTCTTPIENSQVANKAYVDATIIAEFEKLFSERIIIGTGNPEVELETARNKAIFFKHK